MRVRPQALQTPRSLVSFRVGEELPFRGSSEARITELRSIVAAWFDRNARSGVCRVHHRQEPGGTAFVIWHGDTLKRFDVLDEKGNSASIPFQVSEPVSTNAKEMQGEFAPGGTVVDANTPTRIGITTGRTKRLGGTLLVEVAWGTTDREFVPAPLLKVFTGKTIEAALIWLELRARRDARRLLVVWHGG